MIAENLKSVRQRIAKSCEKVGRPIDSVRLVCVTKEASIDEIKEALDLGARDLGENRVQDAALKYKLIGDKATWHLVGHLQTNKARDAVSIFSLIHSVDSARVASRIDKEAKVIDKMQDVLIEVNTSGEATKFGIRPGEIMDFLKEISLHPNISIKGLMTIAPEADDPEKARPYFRILRELRDNINERRTTNDRLRILSMGMTNDFEVAIEEGANMVRIGRAIFAPRS